MAFSHLSHCFQYVLPESFFEGLKKDNVQCWRSNQHWCDINCSLVSRGQLYTWSFVSRTHVLRIKLDWFFVWRFWLFVIKHGINRWRPAGIKWPWSLSALFQIELIWRLILMVWRVVPRGWRHPTPTVDPTPLFIISPPPPPPPPPTQPPNCCPPPLPHQPPGETPPAPFEQPIANNTQFHTTFLNFFQAFWKFFVNFWVFLALGVKKPPQGFYIVLY